MAHSPLFAIAALALLLVVARPSPATAAPSSLLPNFASSSDDTFAQFSAGAVATFWDHAATNSLVRAAYTGTVRPHVSRSATFWDHAVSSNLMYMSLVYRHPSTA